MKDSSRRGLAKWVKQVCGWLLVLFGVTITITVSISYFLKPELESDYIVIDIFSYGIFIVGGLYILLMKRNSANIVIGLTGLIIGSADLINECVIFAGYIDLTTVTGLVRSATLGATPLMDVLLIIFSIRYMQGHRRNAIRMSICVVVPLIAFVLLFLYIIAIAKPGTDLMLYFMGAIIPHIILYGSFFAILLSPGIQENLSEMKVCKLGNEIYGTMIVDPKSSIYRDDLLKLDEALRSPLDWGASETIPGAREYSVIFGKDMNLRRMTFRKMEGDDNIRVSIIREGEKAYIQATRFDFRMMLPHDGDVRTCKLVRFFGDKGYFIDISVRDDEPEPRKSHAIDRAIKKAKNMIRRE